MTLVMGILNTTPDSFSDGGKYDDAAGALKHARQLIAEGAQIIDIGGESTRPGSDPVEPAEEQRRVLPVIAALLAEEFPAQLSLDTRHPETARAVLQAAGDRSSGFIINDVSGLLTHPEMPQVVAEFGCEVVITHNRGDAKTMQERTEYRDLLDEVSRELLEIRQRYLDAGVVDDRIILDPGIGFAKTHPQNWELVRNLTSFTDLGNRVLFGASRKGFLGTLLTGAGGSQRPADERDTATAALSLLAAQAGCWAVRVHAPRPTADALAVAAAVA
ncbi:dihydropteroate synthase [Nesterenkonia sp. MY13]|uniref:Dihydropteroate synthase n=1 Tax=Nesterenkonia sedimenti TaxID=1463632 RepID=A0A7X8TKI9_9MICC|nr:dihydropteroate synthase [Nesterenkonia sedimenti]NLS10037.1 dihydropteroate synthase [Nesterenkonia sedimenti]